jgi:hypothetical protein
MKFFSFNNQTLSFPFLNMNYGISISEIRLPPPPKKKLCSARRAEVLRHENEQLAEKLIEWTKSSPLYLPLRIANSCHL